MDFQWDWRGAVAALLGLAMMALAGFVYFSAPSRPSNRWLGPALFLEAVAAQAVFAAFLFSDPGPAYALSVPLNWSTSWAATFLYLGLVGAAVASPLAAPFRTRPGQLVVVAVAVAGPALFIGMPERTSTLVTILLVMSPPLFLYGFLAALDSFRRAPKGSLRRKRARAFVSAFGIRDVGLAAVLIYILVQGPTDQVETWLFLVFEVVIVAYVGFLVYGILKTQLFDIDVQLRWTIQGGTLMAFFVAAFVVVANIAESALDQRFGWVWGGVAAGMLVLALGPLQRVAERLARVAVPTAKRTIHLTRQERLGFYADHVRAAWEDGSIDRSDRALLNNLRARLGLSASKAGEIELQVTSASQGQARKRAATPS